MRIKIIIGLITLLIGIGFGLRRPAAQSPAPPASLIFLGYSNEGRYAVFTLTKRTENDVALSPLVPQRLVKGRWTDYSDSSFSNMIIPDCSDSSFLNMFISGDFGGIPGHRSAIVSTAVPSANSRWRAAMHCKVYRSNQPGSLRNRLGWLFQVIGVRNERPVGEFTLVTDEIAR